MTEETNKSVEVATEEVTLQMIYDKLVEMSTPATVSPSTFKEKLVAFLKNKITLAILVLAASVLAAIYSEIPLADIVSALSSIQAYF